MHCECGCNHILGFNFYLFWDLINKKTNIEAKSSWFEYFENDTLPNDKKEFVVYLCTWMKSMVFFLLCRILLHWLMLKDRANSCFIILTINYPKNLWIKINLWKCHELCAASDKTKKNAISRLIVRQSAFRICSCMHTFKDNSKQIRRKMCARNGNSSTITKKKQQQH